MKIPNWLTPWLFVFLWSTGFIGSKLGAPYAEPLTFLCVRFAIAAVLLAMLVPLFKESWIRSWRQTGHAAVVGLLLHGLYLGGVFIAIDRGVNASFSALIVGLQPLLTVLLAALWLKESLSALKLVGVTLGLIGVALVIYDPGSIITDPAAVSNTSDVTSFDTVGILFCLFALVGITVGTLYQKRYCGQIPLVSGAVVQYAAVAIVLYPLTVAFEHEPLQWSATFIFAMVWLVVVLSLGAVLLLMRLLRDGEAGQVASLFYLVPPLVAVEAWLLFNEQIGWVGVAGFVFCAAGVATVTKAGSAR